MADDEDSLQADLARFQAAPQAPRDPVATPAPQAPPAVPPSYATAWAGSRTDRARPSARSIGALVIPLVIAVVLGWSAVSKVTTYERLQAHGASTLGTVGSSHCGSKGGSSATVTYDVDGVAYTNTLTDVGCPATGALVTVVYDETDPTVSGGTDSAGSRALWTAGFLALGAVVVLVLAVVAPTRRR
jgi:hypothetical protein